MTFIIKRRRGDEFFAGFGPAPKYAAKWTPNAADAAAGDYSWAKGQALCMISAGDANVQRKPVRVS